MTTHQIQLVQQSFAGIISTPEAFGQSFYTRLFEVDPALRPLFKGDMQSQSRKLMEMVGAVVGCLNQLEPMISAIQSLGARHASYGVRRSITKALVRRFCGRSRKNSARPSLPRSATPGPPPTRCSRKQ